MLFLNYCQHRCFPITLSSSKGELMIFAFPYCLITAVCYSWTARFGAWSALPWLAPLTAENWLPLIQPSWAPPTARTDAVFKDHFHPTSALVIPPMGVTTPEKPFYMVPKVFLTNSHRSLSDDWLNLLPQPMLYSSQLFSPFPLSPLYSWPTSCSLCRWKIRSMLHFGDHWHICCYEHLQRLQGVRWASYPNCPCYERLLASSCGWKSG